MTLKLSITAAIFILGFSAFIQKDDIIDQPIINLHKHTDTNIHEKIHLHFDKPYYALGDTIWFKAYVVIGSRHQLSALSGTLYVDLINERDSLIKSLKLPVTAGMSMGDFVLDESVRAGHYRIRAYTQWMRNAGEDYFFDQTFMVAGFIDTENQENVNTKTPSDNKKSKKKLVYSDLSNSDVQFFPEGGNLVNGITSRIGFKTVGINGLGIQVKAVIVDSQHKEVSTFETLHAGMGTFNLRPESGENYIAKITFTDGSEKSITLPKPKEQGNTLAVYQPNKDSILVRINTSSPGQTVNLIAQSGRDTIFSSLISLSKTVNSVWLEKKAFPTGIAQFTLFNDAGEPTNERIAFIKTNDQMQLKISTAKKTYKSREQISIELKTVDSKGKTTSGNFSVSIIDESKVPLEESLEHTIFSNLLLTSELKGYIEKPNYYFTAETDEVNTALDNLMLTQGYRRFDLKPQFAAEGLAMVISGKVLTLGNKPLPNASVTLMSLKANIVKGTTTDSLGRFSFEEIILTDSIKFAVQAKTPKNSSKAEIILDSVPKMTMSKNRNQPELNTNIEVSMEAYVANSRKQDSIYEKIGQLNRVQRLREVNIRARKPQQIYAAQGSLKIPDGHADRSYIIKNGEKSSTLRALLQQHIPNVNFSGAIPTFRGEDMDVILDGRSVSGLELEAIIDQNDIDITDIVKVDAVTTNMALKAMLSGKPAILIYTKKDRKSKIYTPNLVNISPKGFNKVRAFYSPKYDVNNNWNIPDLRSTIYWNSSIKTYATGLATINFFNADGPGNYKVIIEGINAEGELARQISRYVVGK
nr:hypothetical protein [Pedobacter panaciterrae]